MEAKLAVIKEDLIQGLGRFSGFAGFNKIIGQIYGLLYMSRESLALGEIAEQLGISKGNISLNVRSMEQWGLLSRFNKRGDRKDYYEVEMDFWKVVSGILAARDEKEVEQTLSTISDSLATIDGIDPDEKSDEVIFYKERLEHMQTFGNTLVGIAKAFLALK